MTIETPAALRDAMTPCQTACVALRRLLRDLGAPEDRIRRIVPQSDETGQTYVYMPPMPTEIVQHLVRLLPTEPRR